MLGTVLLQEYPIAYAFIPLTESQQRCSQIESSLIAIVIGYKKISLLCMPTNFVKKKNETDHKPLIVD